MTGTLRGRGAAGPVSWLAAQERDGGGDPDPDGAGFDVVLLCGQSNMDGAATIDGGIDVGDARIWTYPAQGPDTDELVLAVDPLQHPAPSPGTYLGPGMPFAREWITLRPSDRKVLLVPCAIGGTGLAGGDWARGQVRYNFAVTHARDAMDAAAAAYPEDYHRYVAVLWSQGENDAVRGITESQYAVAFDLMMQGFRYALNEPELRVVLGPMVPEWRTAPNGTSLAIHAAHIDTPDRDDWSAWVDGPGTGYGQDTGLIHWNAVAQRYIGEAMATALFALPEPDPVPPPDPLDPSDPIRVWPLDEVSGDFVDSVVGDLMYSGAFTSAVRTGDGIEFNLDVNDYVHNTGEWLNGLTEFSVAFTVESTASTGLHALVVRDDAGRPTNHQDRMFYTGLRGTTGKVFVQLVAPDANDASGAFDGASSVNDGDPHRVVITVGGGRLKMYVDGALDGSDTYAGGPLTELGAAPLILGSIDTGTASFDRTWPLDGLLRDVWFWSTELAPEVAVTV